MGRKPHKVKDTDSIMADRPQSGKGDKGQRPRFIRPVERQRMRPWLIEHLDKNDIPGLAWVSRREKIFRIAWKHAANQCFNMQKDTNLFERWAIHTGRHYDSDHKRWKANFRCALNSLPDVMENKEQGIKKGNNAFKVYKFLDEKDTKQIKDAKGRKKKAAFETELDSSYEAGDSESDRRDHSYADHMMGVSEDPESTGIPKLDQLYPTSGVDLLIQADTKERLKPLTSGASGESANLQAILAAATASLAAGSDAVSLEKISIEQLSRLGEASLMKLDIRRGASGQTEPTDVFLCFWCEKVFRSKVELFQHFLIKHKDKLLAGEPYGAEGTSASTSAAAGPSKLQKEIEDLEKEVFGSYQSKEPSDAGSVKDGGEVIEDGEIMDVSEINKMTSQEVYYEDQALDLTVKAKRRSSFRQEDITPATDPNLTKVTIKQEEALDLSMAGTSSDQVKGVNYKPSVKRRRQGLPDIDYTMKFGNYGISGKPRTKRQMSLHTKKKEEMEEKLARRASVEEENAETSSQRSMEDLVHAEILMSLQKTGASVDSESGDGKSRKRRRKKSKNQPVPPYSNLDKVIDEVAKGDLGDDEDEMMKAKKPKQEPKEPKPERKQKNYTLKAFKCGLCLKKFENSGTLALHVKTHKENFFKCERCESYFKSKEELANHVSLFHNRKFGHAGFECNLCSEIFLSLLELKDHMNNHPVLHKCEICGVKFKTDVQLKYHNTSHLKNAAKLGDGTKTVIHTAQKPQKPADTADRNLGDTSQLQKPADTENRNLGSSCYDDDATVVTMPKLLRNKSNASKSEDDDCSKGDSIGATSTDDNEQKTDVEFNLDSDSSADEMGEMKKIICSKDTEVSKDDSVIVIQMYRDDSTDGSDPVVVETIDMKDNKADGGSDADRNPSDKRPVKDGDSEPGKDKSSRQKVEEKTIVLELPCTLDQDNYNAGSVVICDSDSDKKLSAASTTADGASEQKGNEKTVEVVASYLLNKNSVICGICSQKLRVKDIHNHLEEHDKNQFTCVICSAKLASTALSGHIKLHTQDELSEAKCYSRKVTNDMSKPTIYRRPEQKYFFASPIAVKMKMFVCNLCNQSFNSCKELADHVEKHLVPKDESAEKPSGKKRVLTGVGESIKAKFVMREPHSFLPMTTDVPVIKVEDAYARGLAKREADAKGTDGNQDVVEGKQTDSKQNSILATYLNASPKFMSKYPEIATLIRTKSTGGSSFLGEKATLRGPEYSKVINVVAGKRAAFDKDGFAASGTLPTITKDGLPIPLPTKGKDGRRKSAKDVPRTTVKDVQRVTSKDVHPIPAAATPGNDAAVISDSSSVEMDNTVESKEDLNRLQAKLDYRSANIEGTDSEKIPPVMLLSRDKYLPMSALMKKNAEMKLSQQGFRIVQPTSEAGTGKQSMSKTADTDPKMLASGLPPVVLLTSDNKMVPMSALVKQHPELKTALSAGQLVKLMPQGEQSMAGQKKLIPQSVDSHTVPFTQFKSSASVSLPSTSTGPVIQAKPPIMFAPISSTVSTSAPITSQMPTLTSMSVYPVNRARALNSSPPVLNIPIKTSVSGTIDDLGMRTNNSDSPPPPVLTPQVSLNEEPPKFARTSSVYPIIYSPTLDVHKSSAAPTQTVSRSVKSSASPLTSQTLTSAAQLGQLKFVSSSGNVPSLGGQQFLILKSNDPQLGNLNFQMVRPTLDLAQSSGAAANGNTQAFMPSLLPFALNQPSMYALNQNQGLTLVNLQQPSVSVGGSDQPLTSQVPLPNQPSAQSNTIMIPLLNVSQSSATAAAITSSLPAVPSPPILPASEHPINIAASMTLDASTAASTARLASLQSELDMKLMMLSRIMQPQIVVTQAGSLPIQAGVLPLTSLSTVTQSTIVSSASQPVPSAATAISSAATVSSASHPAVTVATVSPSAARSLLSSLPPTQTQSIVSSVLHPAVKPLNQSDGAPVLSQPDVLQLGTDTSTATVMAATQLSGGPRLEATAAANTRPSFNIFLSPQNQAGQQSWSTLGQTSVPTTFQNKTGSFRILPETVQSGMALSSVSGSGETSFTQGHCLRLICNSCNEEVSSLEQMEKHVCAEMDKAVKAGTSADTGNGKTNELNCSSGTNDEENSVKQGNIEGFRCADDNTDSVDESSIACRCVACGGIGCKKCKPTKQTTIKHATGSCVICCNEVFPNKEQLMKHFELHGNDPDILSQMHFCPLCPKVSINVETIQDHISTDHRQCVHCQKLFKDDDMLQFHYIFEHMFECGSCPYGAPSEKEVMVHYKSSHWEPKSIWCQLCVNKGKLTDARYKNKRMLEVHLRASHTNVPWPVIGLHVCNLCYLDFPAKSQLDKHVSSAHCRRVRYFCGECKRQGAILDDPIRTQTQLTDHMLLAHESKVKPVVCELCCLFFPDGPAHNEHMKLEHDSVVKEKLAKDSKVSSAPTMVLVDTTTGIPWLQQASKVSGGPIIKIDPIESMASASSNDSAKLDLKCSECNQGHFKSQYQLKQHKVMKHFYPRNRSSTSYYQHVIENLKRVKQYECHVCGKKFDLQQTLQWHLRFHMRKKKFQCMNKNCTKAFSSKATLNSHHASCDAADGVTAAETTTSIAQSEISNLNFHCNLCSVEVKNVSQLKEHLLGNHSDEILTCEKCGLVYCGQTDLDKHQTNCLNEQAEAAGASNDSPDSPDVQPMKRRIYACAICSRTFFKIMKLTKHVWFHDQSVRKTSSPQTAESSSSSEKADVNVESNVSEKYMCSLCKITFKESTDLFQHGKTHLDHSKLVSMARRRIRNAQTVTGDPSRSPSEEEILAEAEKVAAEEEGGITEIECCVCSQCKGVLYVTDGNMCEAVLNHTCT